MAAGPLLWSSCSKAVSEWALIGMLRIVTRRVSEEERRFLADASGYDDPLLAFCTTFRSRPSEWRRSGYHPMSLMHPWDDAAQESSPGMSSGTPQLLAFERLLADLTATFLNLPADRVDAEIDRGLKEIAEFVDVDRTTLMRIGARLDPAPGRSQPIAAATAGQAVAGAPGGQLSAGGQPEDRPGGRPLDRDQQ